MRHFVYETLNLVNGKRYRGVHSAPTLDDGYLGSNKALIRAIRKYGRSSFQRAVLEEFDSREAAFEAEARYADEAWVARDDTYNFRTGGGGSRTVGNGFSGRRHSDCTKQKIAATLTGNKLSHEHKTAISAGMVGKNAGKQFTQEQKERQSQNAHWNGKTTPVAKSIEYNGKLFPSQRKLAEYLGVSPSAISNRISRGNL